MAGQGTSILASDYNAIQTIISGVMGTASGSSGYGQTVNSAAVSGPNYGKITALQWNNLQTDINNAYYHITGNNPGLSIASNGASYAITSITSNSSTITVNTNAYPITWPTGMSITISGTTPSAYNGTWTITGVSTTQFTITSSTNPGASTVQGTVTVPTVKILEADRAAYTTAAAYCASNALTVPPSSQATLPVTPWVTGTRTTPWNTSVTHTVTLTWSSRAAAQYYFNTGGQLQVYASLTGYPADGSSAKDNDWNTLLTGLGTIKVGANGTTGTGTYNVLSTSIGFYQLTTSNQTLAQKITSSPTYTPNQYDLLASINGAGTVITLTIQFQDLSTTANQTIYGGLGPFGVDENVEGTLSSYVNGYYATGSHVSVTTPVNYLPSVNTSGP